MSEPVCNGLCHQFFEDLKGELKKLAEDINEQNEDGSLQDGFSTRTIDDGWVTYKGMSCGFALLTDPTYVCMTFGPDSPFVGYTIKLLPSVSGEKLKWTDDKGRMQFYTANHLARFAIESLAAKVHDCLPELVHFDSTAGESVARH